MISMDYMKVKLDVFSVLRVSLTLHKMHYYIDVLHAEGIYIRVILYSD